ncbi:oligosaccharide flippase family protein [archaeon]|jgi:O-antigen/teichoic acid export membrane protein|nr:oligosaccharide flippase family protein [archaeon]MBT4021822.1 oligosaccharide flippase family protein [archaeon]MBT4272117.1 oligosaccharide flippase family protein [archaeon]MBT4460298.1 oligosaccharide flippase family protein [archaeon]MBT4858922.1 oligosaccharide flippase family protein [archaeon]
MKNPGEYFFTKVSYLYIWRFIELLTIIGAAHFLSINEFSLAFFPIILAYFFMNFFDLTIKEHNPEKIKLFCNTLSLIAPLYGIFVALIIFIISLLYPITIPLRYASTIALFISFKKTAEVYFTSKKRNERIYFVNLISQIVSAILMFSMIYFGYESLAVLVSYLIYNLLTTILLWAFFPFKLKSKFNKEAFGEILLSLKSNLELKFTRNISTYAPLIIVGFLNKIYFSYIFLGFWIGYFMYNNFTIFITDLFMDRFKNMSYDMFKYNLVKITEYLSFLIVPLSLISMVLIPQISSIIIPWTGVSEILWMLLLAGLIKSIAEISRLVFIVEPKLLVLVKITLIEFGVLFFFIIILGNFFGSYGVALAMLITSILISILYLLISQRFIKLDIVTVSKNYFYIVFSGFLSALAVGFLKEWLNVQNIYSLLVIYLIGLGIYVVLTFLFNKSFYRMFIRFIFEVLEE